jgi:hypothetical protein
MLPGITVKTPWSGRSASLANGVGFGRLGDVAADGSYIDPGTGGITDPTTGSTTTNLDTIIGLVKQGIVALNSQEVFQLNLDRLKAGLPPIPTQYAAPTVNLGVAGISPTMLLGGAALLALLLIRR